MFKWRHMLSRLKNVDWAIPIGIVSFAFLIFCSIYLLDGFFRALNYRLAIVNDSSIVKELRYLHDDGDNNANKSYSPWQTVPPSGEFTSLVYGGLYCLDVRTATTTQSFLFDVLAPEPMVYESPNLVERYLFGSSGRRRWEYRLSEFRIPCKEAVK